jgi:hypothetical protein
VVALVLLGLEALSAGRRTTLPVRFVEVFGASSLAGYFFHEMLLFYRVFGFSFEARWGKSADWPQYWALVLLLVACTFVLTVATDRLYRAADQRLAAAAPAA